MPGHSRFSLCGLHVNPGPSARGGACHEEDSLPGVAMSLYGYIAGPHGEADWIVSDPEVNFAEIWAPFETLLMGRRTYESAAARLGEGAFQGVQVFVASRTMRAQDHPRITIFSECP